MTSKRRPHGNLPPVVSDEPISLVDFARQRWRWGIAAAAITPIIGAVYALPIYGLSWDFLIYMSIILGTTCVAAVVGFPIAWRLNGALFRRSRR